MLTVCLRMEFAVSEESKIRVIQAAEHYIQPGRAGIRRQHASLVNGLFRAMANIPSDAMNFHQNDRKSAMPIACLVVGFCFFCIFVCHQTFWKKGSYPFHLARFSWLLCLQS